MIDGSQKKIEDIVVGDKIASVDISTMKVEGDKVLIIPDTMEYYSKVKFFDKIIMTIVKFAL